MLAAVFAGDRRVWRVAAVAAVPLLLLTAFYCLRPRFYYTGTDSVENVGRLVDAPTHVPLCAYGLQLPAHSAFVRVQLYSPTSSRPALHLMLRVGEQTTRTALPPVQAPVDAPSNADFPIPRTPPGTEASSAFLCITADGPVKWGGTPLPAPGASPLTLGTKKLSGRLAVWYLPPAGERSSYAQRSGEIFKRAALFRPGIIGAWTYPLLLFGVLPALALLAVRCLALAAAGRGRRLALWLFVIAAVNASCWALITPVFQGPDEVDHFAYTQSLVERGQGPSHDPTSEQPRWSGAEYLALQQTGLLTDHQVGDSRPPWLAAQQQLYRSDVHRLHRRVNDGGGYTTSAVHGPLYYLALAPAYAAAKHGSVFSQLTLMRLTSALIGALVVLFTFLLARELAPGREWLAALAALLVAYEPMYGFISGIVNNDVGVNAGAAALELLLLRMLRRGITIPWGALTGAVLITVPMIKGTGLSLYPVAGLVLLATLWRHHKRADLYGFLALALAGILMSEFSAHVLSDLQPHASATGSGVISSNASSVSEALHHIPNFLSYLWQALLPRLPFMTRYFPPSTHPGFVLFGDPGFVIFVERAWAAFGWYDVFFPRWVYIMIFLGMVLAVPLGVWAARREWSWVRRHWLELLALVAVPVAVITGFEAAYYTTAPRAVVAEFGRYAFPAIGPVAVLVVGALHAFGRRRMLFAGVVLLVAMIALSYASQLLTLTAFYA
jgi:hypothetical protein